MLHKKKKSHIIIITTVPQTIFRTMKEQIKHIKINDFDVSAITSSGTWLKAEFVGKKLDIPIFEIGFQRNYSILNDIVLVFKIYKLFKKLKPDIIHYSTPKASLLSALAGFFILDAFKIYTIRGLVYYGKKGVISWLLMFSEYLTCLISDKVICNSKSNRKYLVKHYLCKKEKITILGNGSSHGVDSNYFFNPKIIDYNSKSIKSLDLVNKIVFGYVGRLVKEKGIRELIDAWEIFSMNKNNIHLILVGPKDEPRDSIPYRYLDKIYSSNTITAFDNTFNIREFYSLFNVFVFPSYREGFPNVVLEASSMEIPVITTDALGCIDAVLNGKTGFVVKVKNWKEILEKMQFLYSNPQIAIQMGKYGRCWVKDRFDPEIVQKELLVLYKRALNND